MPKIRLDLVSPLILLALLTTAVLVDLSLTAQASTLIEVYDSIPDELLFMEHGKRLSSALSKLDWDAVRHFGTPYGYGLPFWLTAASSALAFPELRDSASELTPHKLLFLSFKWIAIFSLAATLNRKRGRLSAGIFCAAILSCSSFAFYGKTISPEPILFLLTAIALACILMDDDRLGAWMLAAIVAGVWSVFTKVTALPVLGVIALTILLNPSSKAQANLLLRAIPVIALAAGTASFSIMSTEGFGVFAEWNRENTNKVFGLQNTLGWLHFAGSTWERIPLSGANGFIGLASAIAFLLLATLKTSWQEQRRSWLMVAIGVASLLLTTSASGYLDWYLWPSALIIVFACSCCARFKPTPKEMSVIVAIACIAFIAATPETLRRIGMRQEVVLDLRAQRLAPKQDFLPLLSCKEQPTVITDLFIAWPTQEQSMNIGRLIRVRDAITLAGSPTPVSAGYFTLPPTTFTPGASPVLPSLAQATHIIINDNLMRQDASPLVRIVGIKVAPDRQQATLGQRLFRRAASTQGSSLYEASTYTCRH